MRLPTALTTTPTGHVTRRPDAAVSSTRDQSSVETLARISVDHVFDAAFARRLACWSTTLGTHGIENRPATVGLGANELRVVRAAPGS